MTKNKGGNEMKKKKNKLIVTRVTREIVEKVEETELKSFGSWSCFTKASNNRLEAAAKRTIKQLETNRVSSIESIKKFLMTWVKMCNNKKDKTSGCSDTAVRETVAQFAEEACNAAGLSQKTFYEIWDEIYAQV
jgi:hypothetical protein